MVFFFECSDPRFVVYMGRDKFENENLIEYGFPEDIWFHVDNLSSAHVYLRPPRPWDDPSFSIEAIPPDVLSDMCQLTKANSIEGSKQSSVDIVYTPWGNLRKDQNTMDTGTVGFQDMKLVFKKKDVKRDKDILKRIEKTKKESFPDFAKEKEARDVEERHQKKKVLREQKQEQKEEQKRKEEERKLKSYDSLFASTDQTETNELKGGGTIEECKAAEEDFL